MEKELERLRDEGVALARDWKRLPYLGATILLAGPIHLIWGPTVALYAVLCAPALVGTAYYLVGVRRNENREQILEYEHQLAHWDE